MLLAILNQAGLSQTLLCLSSQLTFKQQLNQQLYQFQIFLLLSGFKSFPVTYFEVLEIKWKSCSLLPELFGFWSSLCVFYGWCVTNFHCHGSMTKIELHNMAFIIEMLSPIPIMLHLRLLQYWYWRRMQLFPCWTWWAGQR